MSLSASCSFDVSSSTLMSNSRLFSHRSPPDVQSRLRSDHLQRRPPLLTSRLASDLQCLPHQHHWHSAVNHVLNNDPRNNNQTMSCFRCPQTEDMQWRCDGPQHRFQLCLYITVIIQMCDSLKLMENCKGAICKISQFRISSTNVFFPTENKRFQETSVQRLCWHEEPEPEPFNRPCDIKLLQCVVRHFSTSVTDI